MTAYADLPYRVLWSIWRVCMCVHVFKWDTLTYPRETEELCLWLTVKFMCVIANLSHLIEGIYEIRGKQRQKNLPCPSFENNWSFAERLCNRLTAMGIGSKLGDVYCKICPLSLQVRREEKIWRRLWVPNPLLRAKNAQTIAKNRRSRVNYCNKSAPQLTYKV